MKFGINMYGTHSVRDTGNSDLLQDAFVYVLLIIRLTW